MPREDRWHEWHAGLPACASFSSLSEFQWRGTRRACRERSASRATATKRRVLPGNNDDRAKEEREREEYGHERRARSHGRLSLDCLYTTQVHLLITSSYQPSLMARAQFVIDQGLTLVLRPQYRGGYQKTWGALVDSAGHANTN